MTKHDRSSIHLLASYRAAAPQYVRVLLIALAAVIVFSLVMPQTYTATTTIMPPDSESRGGGLSSLLQNAPISIGLDGAGDNKSSLVFKEILTSRTLLEGVVDTVGLLENPLFEGMERRDIVEMLEDQITIEARKTGALSISADASTGWLAIVTDQPERAAETSAEIANACRMVLDRMNREKSVSRAKQTRAYIERVLADTKQEIDSLQEAMQRFQQENKVFSLDEQMAAIVENAVTIGTALAEAEIELALARQDYSEGSPQVEFLEKKIESLKEQYDRVQTGGLVTTDGFSIPFDKVPDLMRRYGNLLRDIEIKEKINAYLETQRLEELIQEAKDVPTVVELDAAIPPRKRTSPARTVMVFFTWLLVTIGFAVWVPARDIIRTYRS